MTPYPTLLRARVPGAQDQRGCPSNPFYRGASASKKGAWPLPFPPPSSPVTSLWMGACLISHCARLIGRPRLRSRLRVEKTPSRIGQCSTWASTFTFFCGKIACCASTEDHQAALSHTAPNVLSKNCFVAVMCCRISDRKWLSRPSYRSIRFLKIRLAQNTHYVDASAGSLEHHAVVACPQAI